MPRETRSPVPGSSGLDDAAPSARPVPKGMFRKEGEYWTVGYDSRFFRLKNIKGLGYLAHLLRHPAVEFHVLDLAGGIAELRDDSAAVVLRGAATAQELRAYCGTRLADFKVPKLVRMVSAIPRNAMGKVQRS